MKRLFFISLLILTLSSCATRSDEEAARPYIEEGTKLSGEEAASVYLRGLEEISAPSLYYNLAYSYLEAGEYEKAIKTADEALALYPDYLRFRTLKAFALRSQGKIYSYEKALQEILEYDEGNTTIRELLLEHYLQIGRKNDAAAIAKEVLLSDPENNDALRALAPFSSFFAAIAPEEETTETEKTRLWTEPPFLYMPLGIMNGDKLLSGTIDESIEESTETATEEAVDENAENTIPAESEE